MMRFRVLAIALSVCAVCVAADAAEISGDYVESRTCDVFTGPCFANAQLGVTGREAVMAWSIDEGRHDGVDLSGLKVVMAVVASDTLGYGGGVVCKPDPIRSVILVDERATDEQREALASFVRERAGKLTGRVTRVAAVPITMELDHVDMAASVDAGGEVTLATRKLQDGDCVCSNEEIYYPPLVSVDNSAPAYALDAGFAGRGLGAQWANPKTRSAFLATFAY